MTPVCRGARKKCNLQNRSARRNVRQNVVFITSSPDAMVSLGGGRMYSEFGEGGKPLSCLVARQRRGCIGSPSKKKNSRGVVRCASAEYRAVKRGGKSAGFERKKTERLPKLMTSIYLSAKPKRERDASRYDDKPRQPRGNKRISAIPSRTCMIGKNSPSGKRGEKPLLEEKEGK